MKNLVETLNLIKYSGVDGKVKYARGVDVRIQIDCDNPSNQWVWSENNILGLYLNDKDLYCLSKEDKYGITIEYSAIDNRNKKYQVIMVPKNSINVVDTFYIKEIGA